MNKQNNVTKMERQKGVFGPGFCMLLIVIAVAMLYGSTYWGRLPAAPKDVARVAKLASDANWDKCGRDPWIEPRRPWNYISSQLEANHPLTRDEIGAIEVSVKECNEQIEILRAQAQAAAQQRAAIDRSIKGSQ